jgi:GH24 family phage-related lysozyme (muramidase)
MNDCITEFNKYLKKPGIEGAVPYMYLCPNGVVTVGVGHALPTVGDARKLPFKHRRSGKKASEKEIEEAYKRVKSAREGQVAVKYKALTDLELDESAINSLLESNISTFKRELKHAYPGFEDFPVQAQCGLLDLAYNVGTPKLTTTFPNFNKHVEKKDWANAAIESNRKKPVPDGRNAIVRKWFEEAAATTKKQP